MIGGLCRPTNFSALTDEFRQTLASDADDVEDRNMIPQDLSTCQDIALDHIHQIDSS